MSVPVLSLSSQNLGFCVLQPKLTDEEGWKRFCLGECVYMGASSVTQIESALDYKKVGEQFMVETRVDRMKLFHDQRNGHESKLGTLKKEKSRYKHKHI